MDAVNRILPSFHIPIYRLIQTLAMRSTFCALPLSYLFCYHNPHNYGAFETFSLSSSKIKMRVCLKAMKTRDLHTSARSHLRIASKHGLDSKIQRNFLLAHITFHAITSGGAGAIYPRPRSSSLQIHELFRFE